MAVSKTWHERSEKPLQPGVRGRRVCEGPRSLSRIRRRLQMTPRTGRAAKSSASVYPASGAGRRGREPVQRSVRLAKSARRPASTSSAGPHLDGGREPPAALPRVDASSEGHANRLDPRRNRRGCETEGRFGYSEKRRRARVHRVRRGRPSRSPERSDRSASVGKPAFAIPPRTGADHTSTARARHQPRSLYFCDPRAEGILRSARDRLAQPRVRGDPAHGHERVLEPRANAQRLERILLGRRENPRPTPRKPRPPPEVLPAAGRSSRA
jgi:hypothetical protein